LQHIPRWPPRRQTVRPSRSPGGILWSSLTRFVLVLAGIAYVWVASGLRPFTDPTDAAVAFPILFVLALFWRRSRFGTHSDFARGRARVIDIVVWLGLLGLLCAWELFALFSRSRYEHPTVSSIADDLMSVHVGRAGMFAGWLALGWALFVRTQRV
jgi:hypothetical protein